MKFSRRLSLWEYGSEVIAAVAIYILLSTFVGQIVINKWILERRSDLINVLGFALAATGLCFAAFIAVLCTDFGGKLRKFSQAKAYAAAFATPPVALIATIMIFEFISLPNKLLSGIAAVLLIYSVLNIISMFKNIVDLVGLWQSVDKARITHAHQKPK